MNRPFVKLSLTLLTFLIGIPAFLIAESVFRLRPPLRTDGDMRPIPQPKVIEVSDIYNVLYNTWLRHLSVQNMVLRQRPALNVNAWDEVPDSSWFTNRIGLHSVSFEEIVATLEGVPPEPAPWYVIRRNDSGYTPKVDIRDAKGKSYVLKFDPPGARERNSGGERIGTLIMHAAGYNVPHNSITYFRGVDLEFNGESYYQDPVGKRQPLTRSYLDGMLQQLDPMPDGTYRGIASLRLPGAAGLGPFKFTDRRNDDANDIIPHELRRELRGLRVIASWINHVDIKDAQALDMFVKGPDELGFVKHYLLDFSATLGAYEWPVAPYRVGHEYMFDGSAMGRSLLSLGFWRRPWEVHGVTPYREVGYFPDEQFKPDKWKPSFPNLAFENMDDADAYWGAKIVTAFSDDTILKLAQAGEYTNPEATRYVDVTLRHRRDAIGTYWFNRVTPLEEFTLVTNESGASILFRDLAIERGYADRNHREYTFWLTNSKGRTVFGKKTVEGTALQIPGLAEIAANTAKQPPDQYGRSLLLRLLIQSNQSNSKWALPAEVFIGYEENEPGLQVLGWSHAVRP
jgi:hypothetical protein